MSNFCTGIRIVIVDVIRCIKRENAWIKRKVQNI